MSLQVLNKKYALAHPVSSIHGKCQGRPQAAEFMWTSIAEGRSGQNKVLKKIGTADCVGKTSESCGIEFRNNPAESNWLSVFKQFTNLLCRVPTRMTRAQHGSTAHVEGVWSCLSAWVARPGLTRGEASQFPFQVCQRAFFALTAKELKAMPDAGMYA